VLGGSQIIGRLLLTSLGERFSQRRLTAAMLGMACVALVILIFQTSDAGILVFAVLLGTGYGASTPARAALVADLFGVARYAEINGLMAFILTFARAAAPTSVGLLLNVTHSYTPIFWLLNGLAACGVLAILMLKPPKRL
jgi:MFS family permease